MSVKSIVHNPLISKVASQIGEGRLWSGRGQPTDHDQPGIQTRIDDLDELLSHQGWPANGVTELVYPYSGIGELSLLLPALAWLSQHTEKWILWVGAPYQLNASALVQQGVDIRRILMVHPKQAKDSWWSLEEGLKSQSCSAVLGWPSQWKPEHVRRLQMLCQSTHTPCFLFQQLKAVPNQTPCALRLQLKPQTDPSTMDVTLLKRRNGWPLESQTISIPSRWLPTKVNVLPQSESSNPFFANQSKPLNEHKSLEPSHSLKQGHCLKQGQFLKPSQSGETG